MNMPILTQFQNAEQSIVIDGAVIHRDQFGRYCLNDLHKASGGADKHAPFRFIRNDQTQALIGELNRSPNMVNASIDSGIPLPPVEVIRGGLNQGTYVVKQIVYAYAMWISANFHLKVINTFDALVTQKQISTPHDYLSALKALVESEEQKQAVIQQLEIQAPKVAFVDKYVAGNGNKTFRQVAKLLQIKENAFRDFLESNKIMYRLNGEWAVYSNHTDAKRFHVKTGVSESGHAFNQALFTPKGVEWIAGELAKSQVRGAA